MEFFNNENHKLKQGNNLMKKHLLHLNSLIILIAVLAFASSYSPAIAQTLQTNLPITDGEVKAVLFDPISDLIYIGGNFTYVGPNTGHGVGIDNSTGNTVSDFPYVNGTINAVVADGSGGWYIGGEFTSVGGIVRNNIAHISADKSVDNNWNPDANSSVRALVLSSDGSIVYAGGYFTTLAGGATARNYIAAIDASTGTATSWNPNASTSVWALAISGSTIYAGGQFISIGGQMRNYIAAIDASTGTATSWNPNASTSVWALAISGSTIYAGGQFISIGGQMRNYIAAINASTGSATSWNPDANYFVLALAVSGDGSTIYAGGYFLVSRSSPTIGGADRNYIAAVNASTGNATDWNPNADGNVIALAVSGSTVYAGGSFSNIGGQARNCIAAIDVSTGNATGWNPNASNDISSLLVSGSSPKLCVKAIS